MRARKVKNYIYLLLIIFTFLFGVSGCELPKVPSLFPSLSLYVLIGNNQEGEAETTLTQPIVVQVISENSFPVEGIRVLFFAEPGNGSANPNSGITDSLGRAETVWTLGDKVGRQFLRAEIADTNLDSLRIEADALKVCPGSILYRGETYPTRLLDTILSDGRRIRQCWLRKNLAVADTTLSTSDNGGTSQNPIPSDNIIERFCFLGELDNCTAYGGYYNWDEAMQGSREEKAQGICPEGWHIPSDEEWMDLERILGVTEEELSSFEFERAGGLADQVIIGAELGLDFPLGGSIQGKQNGENNSTVDSEGRRAVYWSSTFVEENGIINPIIRYFYAADLKGCIYRKKTTVLISTPIRCIQD